MSHNKEIKLEELENVSGGTIAELKEIITVLSADPDSGDWNNFAAYEPGFNIAYTEYLYRVLAKKYNVWAYIDTGLFGTGLGQKSNWYIDYETGDRLTHEEVLRRLRRR